MLIQMKKIATQIKDLKKIILLIKNNHVAKIHNLKFIQNLFGT